MSKYPIAGATTPGLSQPEVELLSIPYEDEERAKLLGAVSLTESGVAICEHPVSGVTMRLAAVRVADGSLAEHVPFETGDDGRLNFRLPSDRPSKIGFFIGHNGVRSMTSVVRIGDYPGQALVTANSGSLQSKEIMLNLAGLKPAELDDLEWAAQIDLFGKLDFTREHSRGLFSRHFQAVQGSGLWTEQRLVVTPPDMEDLVTPIEGGERKDVFQILGYQTVPAAIRRVVEEQRYSPVVYGGLRSAQKGLEVGLGPQFQTSAKLGSATIIGLQGAFEVNIVATESDQPE
jgi:hypothetical protein